MRRHDLVYLAPDARFQAVGAAAGSPSWQRARRWIASGRPLVAARRPAGTAGLLLGLTLPLHSGRQRLTISVDAASVRAVHPPLPLSRCLARLPAALVPASRRLESTLGDAGVRVGVYGSLAWETVSGEAYRHGESDLDVICEVTTPTQLEQTLAALQRAAAELPCALDGEIRFPAGDAVAWREVATQRHQHGARVLAKGETTVSLMALADLLATLTPEAGHA